MSTPRSVLDRGNEFWIDGIDKAHAETKAREAKEVRERNAFPALLSIAKDIVHAWENAIDEDAPLVAMMELCERAKLVIARIEAAS